LRVEYLPGKDQLVADALSRLPSASLQRAQTPIMESEVAAVAVAMSGAEQSSWAEQLQGDDYFGPIWKVLQGQEQGCSTQLRQRARRFKLVQPSGLMVFAEGNRLCVPAQRRVQLLKEHHEALTGGHVGTEKCHLALARNFFWPRMAKDVSKFVTSCAVCQTTKPNLRPMVVEQQPLPVPEERWEAVNMDWITGLPLTQAGFEAILTVTDNTSGRVRLIKTHGAATAQETAQLFLEHVFTQHGLPRKIISDRDPKLTAQFWKELMGILETKLGFSTANYAQADGRAERTNQTVENI
jgi:hypothetical protein